MKRLALCLTLLLAAASAQAGTVKYNKALVNESGLSVSKNYPLSVQSFGIDQVAVQVVWSTPTLSPATFTGGSVSTFTITVTSSPAQGVPGEMVCIANVCLADGQQWNHDLLGFSSMTALAIFNAANLNTYLTSIASFTYNQSQSVVYATATSAGFNYATYSSSQAALTITPFISSNPSQGWATGAMFGGSTPSWTINTGIITSTMTAPWYGTNGQTPMVGLPLLYSGSPAIGGLTTATTYFYIPVSPSAFGLSTTSTGAVVGFNALPTISSTSGTFIFLTSSQTVIGAPNKYTLTPSTYSATTTLTWQASNDGMNWTNVASTQTMTLTPNGGVASSIFDFGNYNWAWLQANVARTQPVGVNWSDGINMLITINGKNSTY